MKAALGILLCAVLLVAPQMSQAGTDPVFSARKAAEDLRAATRALKDARQTKDRVHALSRAIAAYEDGLQAMRQSLRKAAIRERAIRLKFASKRAHLSQLLGVLQTLERASSPLLLIHPSGPLGTARAGMMVAEVTPALQAQAQDLRAQIEELVLLKTLQSSAREDLQKGLQGVQAARLALSKAVGERTNLPRRYVADAGKLKSLARDSETLDGFAKGLADLPFDENLPKQRPFKSGKGFLPLPVYGTILRHFNEADAAGLRRPGLLVSAPSLSQVTTPWAATIRYRGPLLDYGNVIILEPEAGYLIVLAGLGQVYGDVGDVLGAGDPVGLLGGKDPAVDDFLVEASKGNGQSRTETLYVEIRQNREAIDPEAWFALENR